MERVYYELPPILITMSRRSRGSVAQLTAIGSVLAALSLLASHNSTFKKEEPNGGRCVRTRSSTR